METQGLRIGFVPGVTLTKWRGVWAERYRGISLEVVAVAESDQRRALDDSRVDVCFVRLPLDRAGLHLIPLYEEIAVVIAPKDHPLALYAEVSTAELDGETVLDPEQLGDLDPAAVVDLVAGGAGIAFAPESVARSQSRRDLVYRPVTDREPTRIGLAWRMDRAEAGSELAQRIEDLVGVVRGRTANSSRGRRRS